MTTFLMTSDAIDLSPAPHYCLVDHASETYPHFESERGQREIKAARKLIERLNPSRRDGAPTLRRQATLAGR